MGKTVFLIDDEITIREVVRKYLERDGFTVIEARSGTEALTLLGQREADLIVLDIMLPGLDGFTITRQLRGAYESDPLYPNHHAPVIMLTSRTEEPDRLLGFELGVDDYVIKPFSPRELVARVKAVLRRNAPPEASEKPLIFPELQIDPSRRTVTVREQPVMLTAKEFDLLWLLARHPQQVFTRDQLLDQVWGYEFYGGESTVTVHIRRLREKIEPDPSAPTFIQTVWGIGYKFEPA